MCVSYGARWRAHGDHSPCATPRQQLRSFSIYQSAPYELEHLAVIARVFRSRFASLLRDASRLCRRSAFVSAGALHLVSAGTHVSFLPGLCCLFSRLWSDLWSLLSSLSAFCSLLCRRSVSARSSLLRFCLISASATPIARRVAFYTVSISPRARSHTCQSQSVGFPISHAFLCHYTDAIYSPHSGYLKYP